MAGKVGGTKDGPVSDPNVIPFIDILLVLLIIFMLLQPMMRKAIDLQLPDPTPSTAPATPSTNQIILQVGPGGKYTINKEAVAKDRLGERLKEIYDPRPDKIMFVKGDGKAKYQEVIEAMDVARGAGVKVIGVAPGATPGTPTAAP
jgi:biopolymer transport protein TolR